jgi:site-specific recombinase XerD
MFRQVREDRVGTNPTVDYIKGEVLVLSIKDALEDYLSAVGSSRSPLTHRAYSQAADRFTNTLSDRGVIPSTTDISELSTEWISWLFDDLRPFAVATERLTLTALAGFYEFVAAEGWAEVNLPALKQLRQRRARREATRLPPFPREEIEKMLLAVNEAASAPPRDEKAALRILRDRALLFVLADTGLRVAEACSLTRGHLNWSEAQAIVLGKGNQEAVVRFSRRCLRFLRSYLEARKNDGVQGRPLASLPVFARHDRGAGKKILPLSPRSVENIVAQWVESTLGSTARGTITPHTLRHYFVTMALRGSGGNIRLAQELARHRSISTTERYTHLSDDELDRGYREIFDADLS